MSESQTDETMDLINAIRPLFSGRAPMVVGAALADLLATLLAAHIVFDDDGAVAREPTDAYRKTLLDAHLESVRDLTLENKRLLLAHAKEQAP